MSPVSEDVGPRAEKRTMSQQQGLHAQALTDLRDLKAIIDQLESLGPCPHDGNNALLNIHEHLRGLVDRVPERLRRP